MARWLDQSISKTTAHMESAVVSVYQKWSKEGTLVNPGQSHGLPRLIDACGEWRLAHVSPNSWATVAQIAEEIDAGSDRKVSGYTVHRSLLRVGCTAADQSGCPCWPLSTANNGHMSIGTGRWRNGRRWPGLMNHVFFYIMWMQVWVRVCRLPGKHMAPRSQQRQCGALGNVLLGMLHMDVTFTHTWRTTYLFIVLDHIHPFMETVFPVGWGLFQQVNVLCHKAKMVQECFEEHNNEFEVLTWPPNSPYLNPI